MLRKPSWHDAVTKARKSENEDEAEAKKIFEVEAKV